MTTIVYHDNIIAFDSLITANNTIMNDNYNKSRKINGVLFVFAGNVSDQDQLIKAYTGDSYDKDGNVSAIIVDKGQVYEAAISKDDGYWSERITGQLRCLGSGSDHALTAVDCGCDAVQAVKMAIKRDTGSGGRVRTYKVGNT